MTAALTILAFIGLFVAGINFGEIRRDPGTKGWLVGIGLLVFVVCWAWAIWSST